MYQRDLFTFDTFSNTLCTSMSDLGLKPGEIPTSFVVPSHDGEEITFHHYGSVSRQGDLLYHLYHSDGLTKAKLYND